MVASTLRLAVLVVLALASSAAAQPTNVRGWYVSGQVFIVWRMPAPPALPTDTVEVYASAAAQASTANMSLAGRLFLPEYTGRRLTSLQAGARLLLPTPGGGTYRLAADEGVFVYTPRAAGNLFFAVVNTGSTTVVAANSVTVAFAFNPVADPVRPQPQFSGFTTGGNPYTAYVVWAMGSDDYVNGRPDLPVMGDADKNGVPHVFAITEPVGGLPGAGPYPVTVALHGGEGEYQEFRPGMPARANMSLGMTGGIVVTPDDTYYAEIDGLLESLRTQWFGYAREAVPFLGGSRNAPPPGSTVVNFTSRRVFWILDWLQGPLSPYLIDGQRVAILGHSGGARGSSIVSRQRPERFSSVVVYTPPSDLTQEIPARAGELFLRGDWTSPLPTNVVRADGTAFTTTEVFTMTTRLSATQRDLPFTRVYFGKRDQKGAAGWSIAQRAILDSLNASAQGFLVSWDEREHGVELWDNETPDATDGNPDPWPDVGQWIAPVRTRRPAAETLAAEHRAGRTYPGIFNADADPVLAGRQPDPGPGDPSLGDAWGTWGGHLQWEVPTLVDTPQAWAATLYLTGLPGGSTDSSPYASITADLTPRRTSGFVPPAGRLVRWSAFDLGTAAKVQTGVVAAGAEGVVTVPGLSIPRDPARVRVGISACAADYDGSGVRDVLDIFLFLADWFAQDPKADFTGVNGVDLLDIFVFLGAWFAGC